jgi:hypothetical protein
MRLVDRRPQVTRRVVLRGTALAVPGAAAALAISPAAAWAQEAQNLKPATMATLAHAARDIYPHDRLADAHYITAIAGYDTGLPAVRELMATGCALLDVEAHKRHACPYIAVADEPDRVAILKEIETTPFFTKLRSDLIVSLYNQKSLWPKFGYEGASADKGGYINRGFNDIDWLGEDS